MADGTWRLRPEQLQFPCEFSRMRAYGRTNFSTAAMIVPVILCGGSGTRLWPLSTPEKPKQFLSLVTERSLFQETLLRLRGLPDLGDPIVVCNEAHRDLVAGQLEEIGHRCDPDGR